MTMEEPNHTRKISPQPRRFRMIPLGSLVVVGGVVLAAAPGYSCSYYDASLLEWDHSDGGAGGDAGGSGGDSGGGTGGLGGAGAASCVQGEPYDCIWQYNEPACESCTQCHCVGRCSDYMTAQGADEWVLCVDNCERNYGCFMDCAVQFPEADTLAHNYVSCGARECITECGFPGPSCGWNWENGDACASCVAINCECVSSYLWDAFVDCTDPCIGKDGGVNNECYSACLQRMPPLNGLLGCMVQECPKQCAFLNIVWGL